MSRFLTGLVLAILAGGAIEALSADPALSVFIGALVAVGVWFRGFELLAELAWEGLCWLVRAVVD
ncbi:hypothetical protein [Streptomyces sp. NPDC088752]|uniref:hypothetical protein n=1 Tax=Streptomyces sp. NPDC088752 TaxID=3154963 RepID=UPI00342BE9A1